jgi:Nif-specific regulatory protein
MDSAVDELARVRLERDLYRHLLELGTKNEIEPFLEEALRLIAELAGAQRGYIELHDDATSDEAPRFWMARGCYDQDVAGIRAAFSRGVVAEAIASGQTILTASALNDPRFFDRDSIQRNRTEAVLCAPIGRDPILGVLYLQDRISSGAFTEDDRQRAETFAQHLAPLAERLLIKNRELARTDRTLPFRRTLRADGIIGVSHALAKVLQQVSLVAPLDITVLLTGPSGTGKTETARIIHDNSARRSGPFMMVNCAALPNTLIESELFGAIRGAYTGATGNEGKVRAAQGGTLFLDEIGELTLESQAKLLHLLDSKEYCPVGSAKSVQADIRVIAATNVDLKAAVLRKEFREDLLFRLQVLPLRLPSLAERTEDIALLAEHFLKRACAAHKLPELRFSHRALRAIEAAEWPGNVRELAHAVQAAAIRAAGDGVIQVERGHVIVEAAVASPDHAPLTFQEATRKFQEKLVREALEESGWNVTETAARLDVTRSHVYNLIRAFGLERSR